MKFAFIKGVAVREMSTVFFFKSHRNNERGAVRLRYRTFVKLTRETFKYSFPNSRKRVKFVTSLKDKVYEGLYN